MTQGAAILLLLSTLAAGPSGPADSNPTVSSLISSLPAFQFGGGYGDDEGWDGGGGAGSTAQNKNMRVSFYFTALVPMSSDWMDPDSAGADPDQWPDNWSVGLGGAAEFSYLLAPGFRLGGGAGYHVFPGKEDDLGGGWSITYDAMSVIPIRIEAALCFPLGIPSTSWFKGGRGFVKGAVPYLALEVGILYRLESGAELDLGGFGTSEADFIEGGATFGFGSKLGLEFRTDTVGVFFDVGFRYYSAPKAGEDLAGDPLPLYAFPIRIGLALYFGGKGGGY
ncbi:MAG: hypothetical protein ACYTFG_13440 [Planctomycetota bacterium]|jgi:hypothetical protein